MKKVLISILALVLALGVALPMATPVAASHVSWGDTLIADTTLDSDLTGSGTALIIGADGITLDLNGYTLSGDSTGYGVDNTGGYDDVTIKDGAIVGFGQGIRAEGASSLTLKDLSFSGDTGGGHGHVIDIRGGEAVVIKDVTIVVGAGSPSWAEAIRLASIDNVLVTDVDVDGGLHGVNFAFDQVGDPPTNGVVKDSTFTDNLWFGVFIANSTDATIEDNEITGAGEVGIYAGSFGSGQVVTGVVIKDNVVSDTVGLSWGGYGIALSGVVDSEVSENTVTSSGVIGIALYGGSSDNLVKENEVSGSGWVDLYDGSAPLPLDNTWEENEYDTSNF